MLASWGCSSSEAVLELTVVLDNLVLRDEATGEVLRDETTGKQLGTVDSHPLLTLLFRTEPEENANLATQYVTSEPSVEQNIDLSEEALSNASSFVGEPIDAVVLEYSIVAKPKDFGSNLLLRMQYSQTAYQSSDAEPNPNDLVQFLFFERPFFRDRTTRYLVSHQTQSASEQRILNRRQDLAESCSRDGNRCAKLLQSLDELGTIVEYEAAHETFLDAVNDDVARRDLETLRPETYVDRCFIAGCLGGNPDCYCDHDPGQTCTDAVDNNLPHACD